MQVLFTIDLTIKRIILVIPPQGFDEGHLKHLLK